MALFIVALLTWIGLSIAVGSGWGCTISGFNFQSISAFFLSIEYGFCENFSRLQIDFKELFAFITRWIHNVVINLKNKKTNQIDFITKNSWNLLILKPSTMNSSSIFKFNLNHNSGLFFRSLRITKKRNKNTISSQENLNFKPKKKSLLLAINWTKKKQMTLS